MVFHETFTVCSLVRLEGKGLSRWKYRSRHLETAGGGLMMMEPGEIHHTKNITTPADYEVVLFPVSMVMAAAHQMGLKRPPHLRTPNLTLKPVFDAFLRFHKALESPGVSLEKESCLTHVVHLFLESCLDDHPPPFQFSLSPKLLRARELIHSDFERKITLDELAAAAGLSRYHFLRSFRQAFGTPPHAYQNHLRVAKAKSLLARGASLHDATVGFADQSHLIRHFKRATLQLTPSRYAEALTPRR